jgi:uncharacterized protein YcfJ
VGIHDGALTIVPFVLECVPNMANLKPLHFIGALLLATITATSGLAQQATQSWVELQSKFKPDDELKIIDRNGKGTTGRFVSMSGSSLTLLVKETPREFSEPTVREIKQRRPHGSKGIVLGAAIGGVAGGVTFGSAHPGADSGNIGTTAMGVVMGAGIGAGVVALKHLFTRRFDTVFMAPRSQ